MSLTAEVLLMTAQSGGSFVFLKEDSADFSFFVSELRHALEFRIPIVIRDPLEIAQGLFRTRKEDLIFFFPSQISQIQKLSQKLQGQRVLLKAAEKLCSMDYYLAAADPKTEWKNIIQDFVEGLKHLKPLEHFINSQKAPCLFLDRDDVVVKNVPYNKDARLVELMPGIVELIHEAHQKGYWVALVTNQSGLGRGLVNWTEYQQVHQKMLQLLGKQGAWLDECVWAGYIENASISFGSFFASLRKPRSGMFQQVQEKLQADLSASVMIGDSSSDLIAAYSAGLRKLYLLDAGKVAEEKEKLARYLTSYPDFQYSVISEFTAAQI